MIEPWYEALVPKTFLLEDATVYVKRYAAVGIVSAVAYWDPEPGGGGVNIIAPKDEFTEVDVWLIAQLLPKLGTSVTQPITGYKAVTLLKLLLKEYSSNPNRCPIKVSKRILS